MADPMGKHGWLRLTVFCGTLSLVYAAILAGLRGGSVVDMLLGIASGPFGAAAKAWGPGGAMLGAATHFAIMAAMVAAGLWLLAKEPFVGGKAWKAGTLYGLVLYCLMFGVVLRLRFGLPFPDPDRVTLALGLLPHILFVGIPVALAAQGRGFSRKPHAS